MNRNLNLKHGYSLFGQCYGSFCRLIGKGLKGKHNFSIALNSLRILCSFRIFLKSKNNICKRLHKSNGYNFLSLLDLIVVLI